MLLIAIHDKILIQFYYIKKRNKLINQNIITTSMLYENTTTISMYLKNTAYKTKHDQLFPLYF